MTKRFAAVLAVLALVLCPVLASAQPTPVLGLSSTPTQTLFNAAAATGTSGPYDVSQTATVAIQITGTFVGTISFSASADSNDTGAPAPTNFTGIVSCVPPGSTTGVSTSITAGIWRCNTVGYKWMRAAITSYVSGSITVKISGSTAMLPLVAP